MTYHTGCRPRPAAPLTGAVAGPANRVEHKSPRVNCCLEPAQFAALAEESRRRDVSISHLVRESVALWLTARRLSEIAAGSPAKEEA
jgi:hypothetical protein